jgi:hypothetical protein
MRRSFAGDLAGPLAVDKDFQDQGHVSSLLLFALKTAMRAGARLFKDEVRGFYAAGAFRICHLFPAAPSLSTWSMCRKHSHFKLC